MSYSQYFKRGGLKDGHRVPDGGRIMALLESLYTMFLGLIRNTDRSLDVGASKNRVPIGSKN